MNGDHTDDNLLIARAFGDRLAETSLMTGLDEHGGDWQYEIGGNSTDLRVPWSGQISERGEIRREVVVLYDRACAELGIQPRDH